MCVSVHPENSLSYDHMSAREGAQVLDLGVDALPAEASLWPLPFCILLRPTLANY